MHICENHSKISLRIQQVFHPKASFTHATWNTVWEYKQIVSSVTETLSWIKKNKTEWSNRSKCSQIRFWWRHPDLTTRRWAAIILLMLIWMFLMDSYYLKKKKKHYSIFSCGCISSSVLLKNRLFSQDCWSFGSSEICGSVQKYYRYKLKHLCVPIIKFMGHKLLW